MSKRLIFDRGADAFEDGDVTFTRGGHSVEVEDDRAEVLLGLADYDFHVATPEEARAEDEADRAAERAEQAARRGAEKIEAENADDAARTAAFYQSESIAEAAAAGAVDPEAPKPATDSGLRAGEPAGTGVAEDGDGALEGDEAGGEPSEDDGQRQSPDN